LEYPLFPGNKKWKQNKTKQNKTKQTRQVELDLWRQLLQSQRGPNNHWGHLDSSERGHQAVFYTIALLHSSRSRFVGQKKPCLAQHWRWHSQSRWVACTRQTSWLTVLFLGTCEMESRSKRGEWSGFLATRRRRASSPDSGEPRASCSMSCRKICTQLACLQSHREAPRSVWRGWGTATKRTPWRARRTRGG